MLNYKIKTDKNNNASEANAVLNYNSNHCCAACRDFVPSA